MEGLRSATRKKVVHSCGVFPLERVSHALQVIGTQIQMFLVDRCPEREEILTKTDQSP